MPNTDETFTPHVHPTLRLVYLEHGRPSYLCDPSTVRAHEYTKASCHDSCLVDTGGLLTRVVWQVLCPAVCRSSHLQVASLGRIDLSNGVLQQGGWVSLHFPLQYAHCLSLLCNIDEGGANNASAYLQ